MKTGGRTSAKTAELALHILVNGDKIREVWKWKREPGVRFQVNFNAQGTVVGQQPDAPKFIEN
jgi:hypothetical protein